MQISLLPMLSVFTVVVYCEDMSLHQLSTLLYSGINRSVKPCDNFYEYVCGKWLDENPRVRYTPTWDLEAMIKLKSFERITDILKRSDIDDERSKLYREKQIYEACIDTTLRRETEMFEEIFNETLNKESWQDVAKYFAAMIGETFLFQIILDESKNLKLVGPYKARTNARLYEFFEIRQVDDFFYHRYGIDNETFNEHREPLLEFIQRINDLVFGADFGMATYTVKDFIKYYNTNCTSSRNSNAALNWAELLQLLANENQSFSNSSLRIAIDIDYISELCEILKNTTSTTVVQYMQFNFEFSHDVFAYLYKGFGEDTSSERFDLSSRSYHCINHLPTTHGITDEITNTTEFIERKRYVERLIPLFKPILIEEINRSWMSNVGKNDAALKIRNTDSNIVELSYHENSYFTEHKSISYRFNISDVAFMNLVNFKKAQTVHKFKKALRNQNLTRNRRRRTKREIEIIAQYEQTQSAILLSPAYFFPPSFHPEAPLAYNMGRLGLLIGHELSHAFDVQYITKNYYESSWSESDSHFGNIFNERKSCLINTFNELGANGAVTLNENYADLIGLKTAFKVMTKMIDENPSLGEKTSPFKKFDAKKLFFISFANHYCEMPGVNDDDDEHAPGAMRIIGTLQNMEEFSEEFKCRANQYMNPINKCDFWKNETP